MTRPCSGADLVLQAGCCNQRATLVIDGERIADVSSATASPGVLHARSTDTSSCPVSSMMHVHGVGGHRRARWVRLRRRRLPGRLPKFRCDRVLPDHGRMRPARLRDVLESVARLRGALIQLWFFLIKALINQPIISDILLSHLVLFHLS
jgi:hypothetical protein